MEIETGYDITEISSAIKSEKQQRLEMRRGVVRFGIDFLDQNFVGMFPGDIILLGAKTGGGKTTIVRSLAINCITQKKRVVVYDLESRKGELVSKLKYTELIKRYYLDKQKSHTHLRYPNWLDGQADVSLDRYESEVDRYIETIKNFKVITRKKHFGLNEFRKSFLALENETDVFIIDHIHYFDTDGTNENKELTDTIKEIRDMALHFGKIIILVAHLRKKNINDGLLVPSLDDFHGSSNLVKIATKAIMLAPYPEKDKPELFCYGTLMHLAKFRDDGAVTRFCGVVWMDMKKDKYISAFHAGYLTMEKGKQIWKKLDDDKNIPFYLRSPEALEFS